MVLHAPNKLRRQSVLLWTRDRGKTAAYGTCSCMLSSMILPVSSVCVPLQKDSRAISLVIRGSSCLSKDTEVVTVVLLLKTKAFLTTGEKRNSRDFKPPREGAQTGGRLPEKRLSSPAQKEALFGCLLCNAPPQSLAASGKERLLSQISL